MRPSGAQDSPAGHDDDILCDAGHLLDGQVAHPTEGGLGRRGEKPCNPWLSLTQEQPCTGALPPPGGGLGWRHLRHWTERVWSWQRRPRSLPWSPGAPPVSVQKEASAWDRKAGRLFLLCQPRSEPQTRRGCIKDDTSEWDPEGTQRWAAGCHHPGAVPLPPAHPSTVFHTPKPHPVTWFMR